MNGWVSVAFFVGVIAYSAAATLFFVELARRESAAAFAGWAPRILALAAVSHAAHIVGASLLSRICPVESVHFALSLTALIATTGYLLLRRRLRMHPIGVAIAPLALVFLVSAQFVNVAVPTHQLPRGLLALHVTSNLIGVGLFLLAGAAAVFYLVEERRLKTKRVNWLTSKMPPLEVLDRTEHRLLLVGFPLLTLGITTGAIFASELGRAGGVEFTRALLAYGAWLMLATMLLLRAMMGWRGRPAAYGTVAGAFCILLVIVLYVSQPGMGGGL